MRQDESMIFGGRTGVDKLAVRHLVDTGFRLLVGRSDVSVRTVVGMARPRPRRSASLPNRYTRIGVQVRERPDP